MLGIGYLARYRNLVVIAIALLAVAGGYRWGYSRLVAPLTGDGLSIPDAYLDFGTAVVQEDFLWKAPLENHSQTPIEIAGFDRSCGCAAVTPTSFTLQPGEIRWLQIHLNLRSHDAFTFSGAERDFSVTLRPLIAKSMTPGARWDLHGKVQSPFHLVESQLHFAPDGLIAGRDFAQLVFTLAPRMPVRDVTVEMGAQSAAAQVSVEPLGRDSRISLRPDPALAPGVHDFRVVIAATGPDGRAIPKQTLRLPGRVLQDVAVEPPYVRLQGSSKNTQHIRLYSRTNTPFQVTRVENSQPSVHMERVGTWEGPATEAQFNLKLIESAPKLTVSQVLFHVRSDNTRAGEFSVPLQVVVQPEPMP